MEQSTGLGIKMNEIIEGENNTVLVVNNLHSQRFVFVLRTRGI